MTHCGCLTASTARDRHASRISFSIDLNLPKRSGSEVLSRVRSSPRGAGIAVIIMSSSNTPADRALARRLGANLYFHKPPELGEFMKIGGHIRALLGEDQAKTVL